MKNLHFSYRFLLSLAILAMITMPASPQTAVPMMINYQGELQSPITGVPVRDGNYDMVFEIFTAATRGLSVWQGSYTAANGNPVEIKDGLFSVLLGSGTGNKMDAAVFKESDRWLEISIEGEALSPRQRITSAAYSFVSENSRLLGGKEPSEFVIQAQGLRLQLTGASPNIVAGHEDNAVTAGAMGATIGGGGASAGANLVTDDYGTIGGGVGNQAGDNAGTTTDRDFATVGGGYDNTASGAYATVGGGFLNQANADFATIAGGGPTEPAHGLDTNNRVFDEYGTIGGGGHNRAGSDDGDPTTHLFATVGGGNLNTASGRGATVGGGVANEASGMEATVGGGAANTASGPWATVGGGLANEASGMYATVGGGYDNTASGSSVTVGGGTLNTASHTLATVGGGYDNTASGYSATVGGGSRNQASADYATIAGGGSSDPADAANTNNRVFDEYGTIGGGGYNRAGSDDGDPETHRYATVAGGEENTASDEYATIGGGQWNTASGDYATVGGGFNNTASGYYATIGGGVSNTAGGESSFAAGHSAKANHKGAFVWGDSQFADIASTAEDQVTFRCLGGVRFTSGSTGSNQQVSWAPGSSSWSFSSDRELKENFVEIDPKEVLDRISNVSITEWNFKGYSQRHIGPVAQDFHALFPLGGSNTMIDSGDLQGLSLAAIQGLHEIVKEKDARISTLEARVEALETLVKKLVESQGGEE